MLSEDCTESLKRWGRGTIWPASHGQYREIAPVDKKTFTLELAEQFGPVLDALGKPSSNVPFMMPARIASTSADQQIKEVVGSGPFKFSKDEWQPGEQAVFALESRTLPERCVISPIAGVILSLTMMRSLSVSSGRRSG